MIAVIKKYLVSRPTIFFLLDWVLIPTAVACSFLLRFDGRIPANRMDDFVAFTLLALIFTFPIFFVFQVYKISWSFVSLTDVPKLIKAGIVSVLLLATSLYLFHTWEPFSDFPRSIVVLFGIFLMMFAGASRFGKRIYWQIFRSSFVPKDQEPHMLSPFIPDRTVKTILITGGAGYLGSVLVGKLLSQGYLVKVVDALWFGEASISSYIGRPNFQFFHQNVQEFDAMERLLFDVDAVVHMAALVGEPACAPRKELALHINYLVPLQLARLCKAYNISRFIFFSSCSTYGKSESEAMVTEYSAVHPVDFYGETKVYAERELAKLIDSRFKPIFLRLATVYGLSPRMRFDLVVNTFVKKAMTEGEITVFGGQQWRPLVHTHDVAHAITLMLEAPLSKVGGETFNVGDNKENYIISQLGDIVKELVPGIRVKTFDVLVDERSYKVSFSKIERVLGFHAKKTVREGMEEIQEAIKQGMFGDINDTRFYNHLVGV